MNKYLFWTIIFAASAFIGCSGNNQPVSAPNTQNTATVTTPAPSASQASTTTTDSSAAAGSPIAVFNSQNDARKRKDAATMKNNLSRASLALIEETAKRENMSVDDWLTIEEEGGDQVESFQTRNEKINGDTATIEISAGGDDWGEMPFVKEDGRWKIAMDKYVADLQKELEENPEPADEQPETTKPESK